MIKIAVPIRLKAAGFLTLGPKPGTPEYAEEQRARAEGRPFAFEGARLTIEDGDDEPPPTLRSPGAPAPPPEPPPES